MAENKDIANRDVGQIINSLGIGAALAGAIGFSGTTSALGLAGAVLTARDHLRKKREAERTRILLNHLALRLKHVEQASMGEEELDLFTQIVDKAIKDEDQDKVEYHASFIAWTIEKKPPAAIVRMVGETIARLTLGELVAFMTHMYGQSLVPLSPYFDQHTIIDRLRHAGLIGSSSMLHHGHATSLGDSVAEACGAVKSREEWWKLGQRR